jgi:hypothetical protein
MFLFQHPEDYLHALETDRARDARQRRLLRDLRAVEAVGDEHEGRPSTSSTHPCPEMGAAVNP